MVRGQSAHDRAFHDLSVRLGGAAAVAVGVGADENIGVDAVAVLKAQLHADIGV